MYRYPNQSPDLQHLQPNRGRLRLGEPGAGRLRRHLPRKTDLVTLPPELLETCPQRYNNTPRKCLSFLTPNEALAYASSSVALRT